MPWMQYSPMNLSVQRARAPVTLAIDGGRGGAERGRGGGGGARPPLAARQRALRPHNASARERPLSASRVVAYCACIARSNSA